MFGWAPRRHKLEIPMHTLSLLALLPLCVRAANPVQASILFEPHVRVEVRKFAEVPQFNGSPSRLVSIVNFEENLYVCTETSGGLIYKIDQEGNVSLFFDVANALIASVNRTLDTTNTIHGGLRGVAFHPDFSTNGKIYTSLMEERPQDPENFVYFSDVNDAIGADSVVIEWTYDNEQQTIDPLSYRQVIRIGMPVYDHPIKQIAFYEENLYITHGDGSVDSTLVGGGQANDGLGKILRINPLESGSQPYTIPEDNPFNNISTYSNELYAIGFNNPHHLCFSSEGELIVADAGRDNVEEVNFVSPGANYGWPEREGTFVHLDSGGLLIGVAALPANDSLYGFTYPAAQFGHEGQIGAGFVGQAIAGGCPVQNGSPMDGRYFYADFVISGKLYYSYMSELRDAITMGEPDQLSQAQTYQAKVYYDHDNDDETPSLEFESLGDIVREDMQDQNLRADVRFGRGQNGEIYWSSKKSGHIYIVTNSVYDASIETETVEGSLTFENASCTDNTQLTSSLSRSLANYANVAPSSINIDTLDASCKQIKYAVTLSKDASANFRDQMVENPAEVLGSTFVDAYGIPSESTVEGSDDDDNSDETSMGFIKGQTNQIIFVCVAGVLIISLVFIGIMCCRWRRNQFRLKSVRMSSARADSLSNLGMPNMTATDVRNSVGSATEGGARIVSLPEMIATRKDKKSSHIV